MKILDTNIKKIDKVVHMADIHIRLFKRHEEYRRLFKKLYKELKEEDLSNGIIVVAGDILHAKLDLSPEAVELTSDFLKNLADIAPTIVTLGNHDVNLSNPHRMDSLTPIINNINHKNLYYLLDSDIYQFSNVQFAVFSIKDPPEKWPNVSDMTSDIKLGLYHGPVYGAKTDTNYTITSRHVEINKFDGLDIVLLGDIHRAQVLQEKNKKQNKPVIAYPGSLIQQNHGESLKGHGYVIWNLNSFDNEFKELENDVGYVTLEINDKNLNKFVVPDDFPKNIRLRLFTSIENTKLKKVISIIKKKYNILDIFVNPEKINSDIINNQPHLFDIGDLTDINIQNSLIVDWLKSTYVTISDEIIESVCKINKKMNELIYYSDQSRNIRWKPLWFEFSNLFSFGEDNFIDFTKLDGANGIFAPNTSGKSSSMEAVSFALFDKTPRAFRGDHIMNIRKKNFHCKLSFEVNGVKYFIKRNGKKNNKGAVRVDVEFWKENDDGSITILNGEDRFATNANIRSIVGTYEDFILTTLSGQTGNALFIDKSNSERKILLNQFMGLNIFELLEKIANEESKQIQGILKKFSREDFTDQLVSLQNDIEQHNLDFLEVQTKIEDLETKSDSLQIEIENFSSQKINIPITITNKDTLLKNKTSNENKINQIEKNIDLLKIDIENIKNKIDISENNIACIDSDQLAYTHKHYLDTERVVNKLEQEYTLLSTAIDNKNTSIKQISKFRYNPDCEICVDNNKSKLEQISEISFEISELTNKSHDIVNKIEQNKKTLSLIKKDYDLYISINAEIKLLEKYKIDYRSYKNDIDKYENQLDNISNEINKINSQLDQIDQYFDAVIKNEHLDKNILKLKQEYSEIKKQITELNSKKLDIHSELRVKENNRSSIIKQLEETTKIEQEFEAFRYYLESISKDGLPYTLISRTIPGIQSEINNILSQIVPFSIALDVDGKNFGGRIVYDHEKTWPLENSSGMERFISSLAIRVALLKASNLPKSNFLIIDEGFSTLDSEYIHTIQMLFDILKTQFDYIIVISHLDNIRDMVDNIIEIKKVNGYSHINNAS